MQNQEKKIKLGGAFLLWIVSIILKWIVGFFSIFVNLIYYIGLLKWKSGRDELAKYFYNRALSNDQHGNACYPETFRLITCRKGGEPFGNPDDTISYVLARNKIKGKNHFGGRLIGAILDAIDYRDGGHLYKAIVSKIESDQEALIRIQQNEYFKE